MKEQDKVSSSDSEFEKIPDWIDKDKFNIDDPVEEKKEKDDFWLSQKEPKFKLSLGAEDYLEELAKEAEELKESYKKKEASLGRKRFVLNVSDSENDDKSSKKSESEYVKGERSKTEKDGEEEEDAPVEEQVYSYEDYLEAKAELKIARWKLRKVNGVITKQRIDYLHQIIELQNKLAAATAEPLRLRAFRPMKRVKPLP